jgi:hypothetical protein
MTVSDHPMNRSSDKGPIKALSGWMADYRSIIWPLAFAIAAMGFKFSPPSRRLDAIEIEQQADHINVQVLVKLQCFNPSFNDEQRAMAGLDGCSQIRQGLPDPSIVRK